VLADPVGSILAEYINDGTLNDKSGSWLVEGIGEDFLPSISDFSRVKKAYAISDAELPHRARAAGQGRHPRRFVHRHPAGRRAEVLPRADHAEEGAGAGADTGNKYLSKMYNDYWMLDNGFLERPQHGDLRDLILRPYGQRDTVVIGPNDLLTTAYQRMKLYDVSQLPVMDGDQLVGIVDESDVLLHVWRRSALPRHRATAMVSKLDRLDVKSPIEALLPVFDRGQVAIVMDGDAFLGLITRIDLLNYLRRRVQ
jgi:cystathionine beta-synthase